MEVSYWVSLYLISLLNGVSNGFEPERYGGQDAILNITDANYVGCTDHNTLTNRSTVVDSICFIITASLMLLFVVIGFCC